jgi:hypothetical protein
MKIEIEKEDKIKSCASCRFCEVMEDISVAECRHSPPSIFAMDDGCDEYPKVGWEYHWGWDFQYRCSFYSLKTKINK